MLGGIVMRALIPAALAASLFATNLYAADVAAPLSPGNPAGVKKAQGTDLSPWWILGGVVVIGIIVAASSGGNSGTVAGSVGPATGTTSTS
jgi:hypothetical protein